MTKTTTSKTAPKKVASSVSYRMDDDRVIHRSDGKNEKPIVRLTDEGGLEYENKEAKRLHPAIIRYLSDEKIEFNADMVFVKAQEGEEGEGDDIANENSAEYEQGIPPPPKMTKEAGDKTPAYVEWLKKHKPKTYRQKYGIIGEGRVKKEHNAVDPKTGRPTKVPYVIDATIATRKTHLTEKPQAQVDDDDGEQS